MKTNNKLQPSTPYTRHTYQTKGGLLVLLAELGASKKQTKARERKNRKNHE